MTGIEKSKREFLKNQSHEQLEIFVLNGDAREDNLRSRLFLLSGCGNFGGQDGTDGSCVECYYNNRELHERCCLFQTVAHSYLMNNHIRKNEAGENENYAGILSNELAEKF